jgi:hypothetical protein
MRNPLVKKLLRLGFYSLPLFAFFANFTEPRAEVASQQRPPRKVSPPLKLTIYKSQGPPLAMVSRPAGLPPAMTGERPGVKEVRAYVRTAATEYGVDPNLALWIVKHESSFNPLAKGDGEASRGLWQISKIYHPEVSDEQAFGVKSSTAWSLERIRDGKINEWSSYRNCRTLYASCPF